VPPDVGKEISGLKVVVAAGRTCLHALLWSDYDDRMDINKFGLHLILYMILLHPSRYYCFTKSIPCLIIIAYIWSWDVCSLLGIVVVS
jgi:hypothetical protein